MKTITAFPETTSHFRRLKSGLIIPATTGQRTFVTERAMFPGFFDVDFERYGTDVQGQATPEALSDVYEMTAHGNFQTLLNSFELDLDTLFLTQDQALAWITAHPEYFGSDDPSVLLPFIVEENRFVASVLRREHELRAGAFLFVDDYVWFAGRRLRLVLPQPTL